MKKELIFLVLTTMLTGTVFSQKKSIVNDTIKLKEVVISSTRNEQLLENTPELIKVITARDIKNQNASCISEVLTSSTGINIEGGTGSGLPKRGIVNMNGFPASYNLVLVDGVRLLSDHVHTGQNIEMVPIENIERIEIIRGASSAQYGSDAMGGIINIITKKCGDKADGSVTMHAGSNDTYGINVSVFNPINKNIKTSIITGWEQSNGNEIIAPTSRIGRMGYTRTVINPKIDVSLSGKTQLYASINATQYRMEWSDGDKYSHLYIPSLTLNHIINEKSGFKSKLNYIHWDSQQNAEINEWFQPEFSYFNKLFKKGTLYSGIDYKYQEFTRSKVSQNDQYLWGMYVQGDYEFHKKFIVMGAIRMDNPENLTSVFSPKFSLLYKPIIDKIQIRASVGKGFHAPTVQELYEQGFGHSGRALRFGNPDLKPEYSLTYTAGMEVYLNKYISLYANSYLNYIENMIIPVYNGPWDENPAKDVWMRENIHSARIYGYECTVKIKWNDHLIWESGYMWSDNKDLESDRQLPYCPGRSINSNLFYNININKNFHASIFTSLKAVTGRYAWNWKPAANTDPANSLGLVTTLADYQKWDAGVSVFYKKNYSLFLNLYNLLEQDIESLDDAYTVTKGKILYRIGFRWNFQ